MKAPQIGSIERSSVWSAGMVSGRDGNAHMGV